MPPEARAVLFDLDDTLYPVVQFLMSGFRAVAAHVEAAWGHESAAVLGVLNSAYGSDRGHEVDVLAARLSLPPGAADTLVALIRTHPPAIRLAARVVATLEGMRASWRVGVVTNGRPDIQARKIAALGLRPLVDTVVLAAEHGTGAGKPEAAPFLAACRALGVTASQTVFVGDDLRCDIAGARSVGMPTIWLPGRRARRRESGVALADLILPSLDRVPVAAGQLLESRWRSHVA